MSAAPSPVELLGSDPDAVPSPDAPTDSSLTVSPGMADWMLRNDVSVAFSCYQSSQLFLAGVTPEKKVSFSFQAFGRAMGLTRKGNSLFLAALFQFWRLENLLRPGEISSGTYDAVYLPRLGYTIGDLDVHEIGIRYDNKPLFINTRYNCLCTVDPVHAFRPLWKPFFISEIAQGDRCHLNGLAMDKGRPRYVTALRQSDVEAGWRDGPEGGLLMDVERNRILRDDLFMPHSPRIVGNYVYLLESGRGFLVRLDLKTGEKTDLCFLPGFVRGLSFHNGYALITLSKPRKSRFEGVPLDDEVERRGVETWCGIAVVELATGEVVEWIKLDGKIIQLFDVIAVPGVRCSMLLGPHSGEMANAISFDLSELAKAPARKETPGRR